MVALFEEPRTNSCFLILERSLDHVFQNFLYFYLRLWLKYIRVSFVLIYIVAIIFVWTEESIILGLGDKVTGVRKHMIELDEHQLHQKVFPRGRVLSVKLVLI